MVDDISLVPDPQELKDIREGPGGPAVQKQLRYGGPLSSTPAKGPWRGIVRVEMLADDPPEPTKRVVPDPDVGDRWGKESDFVFDQNLNGEEATNEPTQSSGGTPTTYTPDEFREEQRIDSVPAAEEITLERYKVPLFSYSEGFEINKPCMMIRFIPMAAIPYFLAEVYTAHCTFTPSSYFSGKVVGDRGKILDGIQLGSESINEVIGAHADGSAITQPVEYTRILQLNIETPRV